MALGAVRVDARTGEPRRQSAAGASGRSRVAAKPRRERPYREIATFAQQPISPKHHFRENAQAPPRPAGARFPHARRAARMAPRVAAPVRQYAMIPPRMKATVTVELKPSVLDPQGKAIEHSLS